ncbi:Hypothetical_protein [Hexamita inflata]|uniref:Hypothetical_protein n=1 Tax=Hexamita inflata TaxID=28002 RepID=A0AA86Q8T8_9EUKA|nr:Hypothetical protein HINF_LOCUS42036 [Hexamita inflata]CAI9954392.1 Hypothetical protein HINF_LOCUS42037 [Hexamita inflata]
MCSVNFILCFKDDPPSGFTRSTINSENQSSVYIIYQLDNFELQRQFQSFQATTLVNSLACKVPKNRLGVLSVLFVVFYEKHIEIYQVTLGTRPARICDLCLQQHTKETQFGVHSQTVIQISTLIPIYRLDL